MNRATFESMLGKILAMFGRNPSQAMNGVCWDVCAELPDIFADFAVYQARDLDKMPGNLSKFLRDSWFRWREAHPSMSTREQEFGCSACSRGVIHYVRQRPGCGWMPEAAICGHCRKGGLTYGVIRQAGGEIVPPGEALKVCAERNVVVPAGRGQDFVATVQGMQAQPMAKRPQ